MPAALVRARGGATAPDTGAFRTFHRLSRWRTIPSGRVGWCRGVIFRW